MYRDITLTSIPARIKESRSSVGCRRRVWRSGRVRPEKSVIFRSVETYKWWISHICLWWSSNFPGISGSLSAFHNFPQVMRISTLVVASSWVTSVLSCKWITKNDVLTNEKSQQLRYSISSSCLTNIGPTIAWRSASMKLVRASKRVWLGKCIV